MSNGHTADTLTGSWELHERMPNHIYMAMQKSWDALWSSDPGCYTLPSPPHLSHKGDERHSTTICREREGAGQLDSLAGLSQSKHLRGLSPMSVVYWNLSIQEMKTREASPRYTC